MVLAAHNRFESIPPSDGAIHCSELKEVLGRYCWSAAEKIVTIVFLVPQANELMVGQSQCQYLI